MKNIASKVTLTFILSSLIITTTPVAHAQILPRTTLSTKECIENFNEAKRTAENLRKQFEDGTVDRQTKDNILGCAIKTGDINLWMIPFYIGYLINFVLALSGLISVLFIVIGGYWYIIGSAQGQTDKGKNTIIYAIAGLIVSLMAWIIVNIVQTAVT